MNSLNKFITELQKQKDFKITDKKYSVFMKFLSIILFFIKFKNYSTTIFNKIYLSKELSSDERDHIITAAHEFKHILDFKNKFNNIAYLFPQILVLLFIPLIFINLWFLLGFVLLLPWPAVFRKNLELEGYKVSLFTYNELMNNLKLTRSVREFQLQLSAAEINKNFTSASYYFMWPFGVKKDLDLAIKNILDDEICKTQDIYTIVRNAVVASRM